MDKHVVIFCILGPHNIKGQPPTQVLRSDMSNMLYPVTGLTSWRATMHRIFLTCLGSLAGKKQI